MGGVELKKCLPIQILPRDEKFGCMEPTIGCMKLRAFIEDIKL
jgi:hypothetical protein